MNILEKTMLTASAITAFTQSASAIVYITFETTGTPGELLMSFDGTISINASIVGRNGFFRPDDIKASEGVGHTIHIHDTTDNIYDASGTHSFHLFNTIDLLVNDIGPVGGGYRADDFYAPVGDVGVVDGLVRTFTFSSSDTFVTFTASEVAITQRLALTGVAWTANTTGDTFVFGAAPLPEPSSAILVGLGSLAIGLRRRR